MDDELRQFLAAMMRDIIKQFDRVIAALDRYSKREALPIVGRLRLLEADMRRVLSRVLVQTR